MGEYKTQFKIDVLKAQEERNEIVAEQVALGLRKLGSEDEPLEDLPGHQSVRPYHMDNFTHPELLVVMGYACSFVTDRQKIFIASEGRRVLDNLASERAYERPRAISR